MCCDVTDGVYEGKNKISAAWYQNFQIIMLDAPDIVTVVLFVLVSSLLQATWSEWRLVQESFQPTKYPSGVELDSTFVPQLPVSFSTENSTVVTAQIGSTAVIPCVVFNIGEGLVSWIRRKDYHLLTVGLTTYTGDERYQTIHTQRLEDWSLQIKFVQARDAGLYECQVSSHPPTSIFIDLKVIEARAEIYGPPEKFLKLGSALQLICTLMESTEPPIYVFWYQNNRMINYDNDRGVNVSTDLSNKMSVLYISNASPEHTGNYSCVPNDARPASTFVHILNGENPAAMQHGLGRGLSWFQCNSIVLIVVSFISSLFITKSTTW